MLANDPTVGISVNLEVSPEQWTVELTPQTTASRIASSKRRNLKVLLVSIDEYPLSLPTFVIGDPTATSRQVQLDSEQALWLEGAGPLHGLEVTLAFDPSEAPQTVGLAMKPPPSVTYANRTGWRIVTPSVGRPEFNCEFEKPCGVPESELRYTKTSGDDLWFGAVQNSYPDPEPDAISVTALLRGDRHLGAANPAPATDSGSSIRWEQGGDQSVGMLDFEILSNSRTEDAQDRALLAGVFIGIGGGVIASGAVALSAWLWNTSAGQRRVDDAAVGSKSTGYPEDPPRAPSASPNDPPDRHGTVVSAGLAVAGAFVFSIFWRRFTQGRNSPARQGGRS